MLDNRMFVIAGKAIFTVDNGKGEHCTFKCSAPDAGTPLAAMDCYFLSVLTGPDNTKDYWYMGIFDAHWCEIRTTKGSKVKADAQSFKVARWLLNKVWSGQELPTGYTMNHEGRCGRCGRKLTVPESCRDGRGPECRKYIYGNKEGAGTISAEVSGND